MIKRLSGKMWVSCILLGLVGQFAWTIENMYFNVFLYNTISDDPSYIASMVAASAAAATVTTLIMGAVSDRVGRRKIFISLGYILWGLSTCAFGFISVESAAAMFPALGAVSAAAWTVVIMDCIMTFFGSTANDAAFNAYVTDTTDSTNRGRIESVLATLPLVSMLVIFGAFDGMTQAGRWSEFFTIFGLAVTATGILSLFLLKDVKTEKKTGPFWDELVYGFKPSVVKANAPLYLSLTAFMVFLIAVQVFFPYLIVYMQHGLGMNDYALVLGVVLIVASVVSVLSGGLIDRIKLGCVMPAGGIMFVGLVLMYFANGMVFVIAAGSVMMSGYMLVTAVLSAAVRDRTPEGKAGHFQGIRMIFSVMIPMVIGPFIGAAVIKSNPVTYEDLGVTKSVPTAAIFLAAAAVLVLVIAPVILLKKSESKKNEENV